MYKRDLRPDQNYLSGYRKQKTSQLAFILLAVLLLVGIGYMFLISIGGLIG